ncbi:MAG TPA: ferritin-like domain-containing protein [Fimbriimonadaceae bacterium]|jgi:ferritin-like metal-binding protein YciE
MSNLNSLQDLFIDEIQDLYSAEKQLVAALPKMAQAATNQELKSGILEHLEQTKRHVTRLDQVFESIGLRAQPKTCKAMQGLIEEGNEMIQNQGNAAVIDTGIIACAQRIEHYEIAGYGCVRTYAKLLEYKDAEKLLDETLDEEAKADETLGKVAKTVNKEALEISPATAGR